MFPSDGVHIADGVMAGGVLAKWMGLAPHLLVHDEILSCGPIPSCSDLQEWEDVRSRFLSEACPSDSFRPYRQTGLLADTRKLSKSGLVYIWSGPTVEEQLMVLFTVRLLETIGGTASQLRLIEFLPRPGRALDHVGVLTADELRAHAEPIPFSSAYLNQCRRAWAALTSSDPRDLATFCRYQLAPSTSLLDAMRCILTRYPDRNSGLGLWDRILLHHVKINGPTAARVIAYALSHESVRKIDNVGDLWLRWRLQRMARLPSPLIEMTGAVSTIRGTELRLTAFGDAVVEGASSIFPTNPIDDWIGGVHVSSRESNVWFYDGSDLSASETS